MSINSNIADFLFKKNLGIVDSQPGVSYKDESSGNAKTKLFSSQLFSQTVPLNIPTDFTSPIQYVNANGTLSNVDNGLGLGTVQTSISYPYIQKVTRLKLTTVVNINTYRFNDPSTAGNINLLQNAIPFNYNPDLSNSYTYSLFAEKGSPYSLSFTNPIATSKYIIDTDAGYLYIVAADWSNLYGTCFVTFYRYNGTMGIPTNLGNFAGAYLQGTGAIAYGDRAGYTGQGVNAIAMGNLAGAYGQGTGSIAIGYLAGPTGMSANSIALNASGVRLNATGPTGGFYVAPIASYSGSVGPFTLLAYGDDKQIVGITGAGMASMGILTVGGITGATGSFKVLAAGTGYIENVVTSKIGTNAGYTGQGVNALAMGNLAGAYGQGTGSIAIGAFAGPTGMSANSIVLNASGTALYGTGPTGGFYVAPIASYKNASNPTGPFQLLAYGPDNQIVTVTGATGLNLSLSTPTVTYDSWLLANMIGAPPAVESLDIDNFTTTDVYITFSYPSQIYSGLSQSGLLPYINNMFVNLFTEVDSIKTLNGVTGSTGLQANTFGAGASNFIAQTTPVDPTNVVQCINVTKSTSKQSGLGTYTTMKTPKTLKSYTIPYTSLTPGQLATFYMWYANNNPTKNVSSIQFTYKGASNPTRVTSLTITPSAILQQITITFTGSSAIDSGDLLSTASINYAISYESIAGSNTRRYGGTKLSGVVNGPTIGPIGTTGGAQSQINTASIYPDTAYYVTVNASNTNLGLGSFTGTTGTSIQTTGPAPPAPQTSSSKLLSELSNLSTNVLSAKSVFGGSTVLNLLKTTTSALPSLTTPFNIHNSYESRGYTGPNPLVNFTTNLSGPVGIIGPSASIYGFTGSYNYPSSSQNGINLSFTPPVDTGSETNGTNGYYLKTDATVSINPSGASNIVASSNQYTMCVTGTYSSGNGAPASAATTFYYDGETGTIGTPSISSQPVISIASAVTEDVSGIKVVTSISFNIGVIGVTGIGQYFYNAGNNGIISYAPTGSVSLPTLSFMPSRETDLSKLTSGTGANGFNTPISFSRNPLSLSGITSSQYYAGPVGVSVTPYNIDNKNGSAISSNAFPLIFDPVSVLNKSNYRVCSVNAGSEAVSYNSSSTSGSRNDNLANVTDFSTYDNAVRISTPSTSYTKEALYTNGTYVSNGSGFRDYTNFSYNSIVNYSSINSSIDYRYVTYKWTILSSIPQFNTISFTLSNLTNYNRANNSIYYGADQTNRMIFFYRFEDSTDNTTKINWGSGGQISTPWIDGNYVASSSNAPSGASAPTSGNANNVYFTPCGGTISSAGNILIVKLPYSINSTDQTKSNNMSLYCRVGLPTSLSFTTSFTDITYTLSTS